MTNNNVSRKIDLMVDFAGLKLKNPVFTASGTCGYIDELADFMDLDALGGFITKSITPLPRPGNPVVRIAETDSGMLNAIGLANIGLEKFVNEKLPIISQYKVPVFVNVAGVDIEDYVKVVEKLSEEDNIAGFELNISCPNVKKGGITFGTDPDMVGNITSCIKKSAKNKILIVKLTPNITDITQTASAAVEAGADALSLINTYTAMVIDIETQKPVLANRTGGLSGPAIKPLAVYLVNRVYENVTKNTNVPILGLGGIRTASDAVEFMLAGASAVSIGTASFSKPDSCLNIIRGLESYCARKGINDIKLLTGALK
jgi:dihydroorotate dehydrogenase (NAD+) catalytic subunit